MQVTLLENGLFEAMLEQVENVARELEKLDTKTLDKGIDDWMDTQQVCQALDITKRTLQHYRDSGIISFTQINKKTYYKPSDVEKLLTTKNQ